MSDNDPIPTDPIPNDPIHARQRARAKVMAIVLAAFAILFFFITIAKMKHG